MRTYFPEKGLHKLIAVCAILFCSCFCKAADIHQKLGIKWQLIKTDKDSPGQVSRLTLYNLSDEAIPCNKWSLWFNFIRQINPENADKRFKIEHKNGDLYRLGFVDQSLSIAVRDSLVLDFMTNDRLPNFSDGPSGMYLTYLEEKEVKGYTIADFSIIRPVYANDELLKKLAKQYQLNLLAENSKPQTSIPSVLSRKAGRGSYQLSSQTLLYTDKAFEQEGRYFRDFIQQISGMVLPAAQQRKPARGISIIKDASLAEEEYRILVDANGIVLSASGNKGVFYAIQTIKSLLSGENRTVKRQALKIPFLRILDKPRFAYRGLMLDVARNFQTKASVMKVIDVMSRYKLNTLHLHLNDDEGWRLEIPALPELTQVGGIRNAGFATGNSLQPAYGSGAEGKQSFYSVADYIEILKYAAARHIEVIPELETPGHARAAVKSMEARYRKYMALGKRIEANEYLLNDLEDRSVYNSAQNWNDNVMNVAKPSTYRFISTVLEAMKNIYAAAGKPLKRVHLGGDEVPKGVWEKSPEIRRLSDSLGMTSVNEIWPYYIRKIAHLCKEKDLELLGWEEMGMLNKGNGMEVNPALADQGIQLDVWNNLVGDGQEDLAYKLANAGYKVVFTSANNFYFDLAWADVYEEPGHSWAGFTDIRKAYSFLPANYFLNISKNNSGTDLAPGYFDQKVRLTELGKANLIGIKGALWTEKVPDQERMEYMLFPRVIALAERAWGAEHSWEKGEDFNREDFSKDYAAFMKKLGTDELPKLELLNGGYGYRLPALGIKLEGASLFCNAEYPGADIFYTTDGKAPTAASAKYKGAIILDKEKTYQFKVMTSRGRAGDIITLKFN
ncbi:family 20 glycosylhydrolase [Pedobacter caeni]|uniref:beta-N-acetylhexosaminidase n=1 Tax=Pedobacter caeni TaxID=288992 RepID=A0A1M4TVL1_9SPHI|nr:family 20 glycosylhydrolase [Pedobacter caeni]SHE48522.1 hexosaminidase [Pedobacter caeni]